MTILTGVVMLSSSLSAIFSLKTMSGQRDITASKIRLLADESIIGPVTTQRVVSESTSSAGSSVGYDLTISSDATVPVVIAPGATGNITFNQVLPIRDYQSSQFRPYNTNASTRVTTLPTSTSIRIADSYGILLMSARVNYATIGGGSPGSSAGFVLPFVNITATATMNGTLPMVKSAARISPITRNIAAWDTSLATTQDVSVMIPFVMPVGQVGGTILLTVTLLNQSNTALSCAGSVTIVGL